LPSEIFKLLESAAAREDRTLSGQARHYITQAIRLAPPPPPPPTPGAPKVMQNVEATPAAIEAAKARVAELRQRRDVIVKRSQGPLHEATPATDDTEFRALAVEIEWTERSIAMAERFV
jgi:hypothetical protein